MTDSEAANRKMLFWLEEVAVGISAKSGVPWGRSIFVSFFSILLSLFFLPPARRILNHSNETA